MQEHLLEYILSAILSIVGIVKTIRLRIEKMEQKSIDDEKKKQEAIRDAVRTEIAAVYKNHFRILELSEQMHEILKSGGPVSRDFEKLEDKLDHMGNEVVVIKTKLTV